MTFDLAALQADVARHGRVARILVAQVKGSAPRGPGTEMRVWAGGQSGTIGGGALELEAIRRAFEPRIETVPLGPALGQCCGGSVTLVSEVFDATNLPDALPYLRKIGPVQGEAPAPGPGLILRNGWLMEGPPPQARPVWIYGAGHVGRALVDVLSPLPDLAITWVDTGPERFPDDIPAGVTVLVAADPARAVSFAPDDAEHFILTYSHEIDLTLCHAVLSRPFARAGLIGSATKWARFRSRLATLGHTSPQIARIACPIGAPELGKHPQAIAIGVGMAILGGLEHERAEGTG